MQEVGSGTYMIRPDSGWMLATTKRIVDWTQHVSWVAIREQLTAVEADLVPREAAVPRHKHVLLVL